MQISKFEFNSFRGRAATHKFAFSTITKENKEKFIARQKIEMRNELKALELNVTDLSIFND